MEGFYSAMENRRSIRILGKEEVISPERLEEIVCHTLLFTPTAFNAQEQRIVLLLGERHSWFWNLLKEKLRAIVPPEKFPATESKLAGFAGGVGTILFYQDMDVVRDLQESFPTYKDNFPSWAHQANGMLTYTIWTSLAVEGYGASLQHYTELVEQGVKQELDIPPAWSMVGQMPFGKAEESPGDKTFEPVEKRMLVFR